MSKTPLSKLQSQAKTILTSTESAIRKLAKSVGARRYDNYHKKEALKAVAGIETYNGARLTPALKKRADDYAIQVLGRREYAPWLYVYALVCGAFKEGWIPDNFFGRVVWPQVNNGLGELTDHKSLTKIVLRTEALPDIAYRLNGVTYDRNFTPIRPSDLSDLAGGGATPLFLKKDGSSQGRGVAKIAAGDITEDTLAAIGNCVIQRAIEQHAFFDEIMSGSVATLRITTVKNGAGEIDWRAAYLRLGRKDTAWVQSGNSVRVAIVDRDGELDPFGYTEAWRRWPAHPDTGFSFAKKRIPGFREATATCVALHRSFPHFAVIGWDVAIDRNDRVRLIEWNAAHCDIKFSEAATGPCFLGLGWERLREAAV
ncbi:MAG TPA: sugar-transfer associated ATP-grasp domain-containing protein [Stellaceae bacterium]|jgi:hypothetical protein|nr:sugar-transfer associated ATP-grasp domain-containing protein [Stellaceae bacterium]